MKILRRILLGLVIVLGLLIAVAYLLPREVHVERADVIDAPPDVVYAQVANLKRNEAWSPWNEMEPTAQYTYSGAESGVGAKAAWKGEKIGEGSQEIVAAEEGKSITTALDFGPNGKATAFWKFEPEGKGTRVVWGFDSDMGMNPACRYFGLFLDDMLGADYEKGLAKLKILSETEARKLPAEMP